jgi:hypothetical protein
MTNSPPRAFLFLHSTTETIHFKKPKPFAKAEEKLEMEYLGICSSNCILITSRKTGMPMTEAFPVRANNESNKSYWQYKIKFPSN